MAASIPAYNGYARKVLMSAMDQKLLAEVPALGSSGKTADPRYMQMLVPMRYEQQLLRRPASEWPEPINWMFSHLNNPICTPMQGPSGLGASGRLVNWDRCNDLARINLPILGIGARHDTMDLAYMTKMAVKLPHGDFLYLPESGQAVRWDEPDRCFEGLTRFLKSVPWGQDPRRVSPATPQQCAHRRPRSPGRRYPFSTARRPNRLTHRQHP
jgi:proline iminopeptidase